MKAEREEKKRDDREKWDKIDGTKADILSKSPYSNPAYSKRHLRFNNRARVDPAQKSIKSIDRRIKLPTVGKKKKPMHKGKKSKSL
ncbi:hypothetical protein PABG_11997 [Paracoccidioides brasiliensis Pb03]|nr:hypothetical protein PABG_11997 [Paracoccidioides brasiliensis Pb03]